MAKESVKILQGKLDVKSLIDQLNAALSEGSNWPDANTILLTISTLSAYWNRM